MLNTQPSIPTQGHFEAMQKVGDYLKKAACGNINSGEKELFARSAINRYYYAVFLKSRNILIQISPEHSASNHKDIPRIFKKTIYDKARNASRNGKKNKNKPLLRLLRENTNKLAELLETGREARVIADYKYGENDISTDPGGNVKIHNVTLSAAQNWYQRTGSCEGAILRAYKQLGLS